MARLEAQKAAQEESAKWVEAYEQRIGERQRPDSLDDVICYRCKKKGHFAVKCGEKAKNKEKKRKRFRSGLICFKCKMEGHFLSDCSRVKKKPVEPAVPVVKMSICYHCKEPGHIARECSERQKGRQAAVRAARAATFNIIREDGRTISFCKECKEWGHLEIDCPNPAKDYMLEGSTHYCNECWEQGRYGFDCQKNRTGQVNVNAVEETPSTSR